MSAIVDDGFVVGPGQLERSDFFALLDEAVHAAVGEALRPAGYESRDCPYLERYLEHYRHEPIERITRAVLLYAPPSGPSAQEWIDAIADRARRAAVRWSEGRADPLVEQLTPTGGADLARSLDAAAVRDRLGPGQPMEGSVRTRAEAAFGVDLSHVRIHVHEVAQRLARDAGALAFTVGDHVGFAAGRYEPGTLRGDALIAHELAHTRQQVGGAAASGLDLESEADRDAVAAGRRLRGEGPASSPPARAGLRLQRCGSEDEPELEAAPSVLAADGTSDSSVEPDVEPEDDAGATTPGTATAPGGTTSPGAGSAAGVDLESSGIETEDLSGWQWATSTDNEEAVILIGEVGGSVEPHLFLLPGRGLIRHGAPAGAPPPSGSAPASRGPLVRMPALGHAGAHLVHTQHGVAALVDAGGNRTGSASTVQVAALGALAARFDVARITDILPSHTHADHVANITDLARRNLIRAANVHINPGLGGTTAGPLGQVLTALRSPQHSANGFGPTWQPTTLGVTEVPGATAGTSTMRSTLTLGTARIDTVVDSATMRRFVAAMGRNDWATATRHADAASLLTRISSTTGGADMLVSGDMRGRDILRLQTTMGEAGFRDFVRNSRTLSGLHHLGAVSTASDVRGIQALLRAMGGGAHQITVVAQTGGRSEINSSLVEALQRSGVRVVALRESRGGADERITISSTGRVTGSRASEWAVEPVVRDAQQRLRNMERAVVAVEATPTYRVNDAVGREQVLSGLRTEVARLRGLLQARMEIAIGNLHSSTRGSDVAGRLATNEGSLRAVEGMERTVGSAEVQRLARSSAAAGRLTSELRRSQRGGYARAEVLRLLRQVDPATSRRIMADELGRPMSRRAERAAWRRAARALRRQAAVERIVQSSGGGTPRARGVAWFGLAMEAWNLASPFIASAVASSRDTSRRDFYVFFRDLTWWYEKGLRPPYRALADGHQLEGDEVSTGIGRRVWDDADEESRRTMDEPPSDASPADQLYIPPVGEWTSEQQSAFWTTLLLWVSTHINDFEDYASEISDIDWAPIRQDPSSSGSFGERQWQLRVGIMRDGHVEERWQSSADLTLIMNTAARRVVDTTSAQLTERWERRHEGRGSGPILHAPGTPVPPQRHEQPTAVRTFADGLEPVSARFGSGVRQLGAFRFWNDHPRFFVHGGIAAPSGYVVVSGADYNTAAAIRSQDTDIEIARVDIPARPRAGYLETFPPSDEEYMTRDQLFAWRAIGQPNVAFVRGTEGSGSRGVVMFYERGPNTSGMLLVERDTLSSGPPD